MLESVPIYAVLTGAVPKSVAFELPSTFPMTVMLISPVSNCTETILPVCSSVGPYTAGEAN